MEFLDFEPGLLKDLAILDPILYFFPEEIIETEFLLKS